MEPWESGLIYFFAKEAGASKPLGGSNPPGSANWENANLKRQARGAKRAASIEFEMAFLAKRKRIYQSKYGSSRFILEMLSFLLYP